MRCSRRNTSNVSTQCYAPARYKSTPPQSTNSNKFCYFSLPDASLSFPWPATCTFAPLCENLSGSDTKFVARIRNTLILGLVSAKPLCCCLTDDDCATSRRWLDKSVDLKWLK